MRLFPFALAIVAISQIAFSGKALAFCRATTDGTDKGIGTENQDSCNGAIPVWWRDECVGYGIAPQTVKDVSVDDLLTVARNAFGRWAAAKCDGGQVTIDARYLGAVNCTGDACATGKTNVIYFKSDPWKGDDGGTTLTLATTFKNYNKYTGEMLGSYMQLNSHDYRFYLPDSDGNIPPPSDRSDQRRAVNINVVVTHEAGHFLGMGHSDTTDAIMYFQDQDRTDPELRPDDIAAICDAYPADGTRKVVSSVSSTGTVQAGICNADTTNGYNPQAAPGPVGFECSLDQRVTSRACAAGTIATLLFALSAAFWRHRRRRNATQVN